jgi:uncharacterized protein (TIGR00661 family)
MRAEELLPEFGKYANVDVLISGYGSDMKLETEVTYRKRGVSLEYNSRGAVATLKTLGKFAPIRFLRDIQGVPLDQYDLVISDYEPISSWAAKLTGTRCLALSHQAAFLSPKTPRPVRRQRLPEQLLKRFAPAKEAVGFHFQRYDRFIEPPLIRDAIQQLSSTDKGHITVYLPSYHPANLTSVFQRLPRIDWHLFSSHCQHSRQQKNVWVRPLGRQAFLDSLQNCSGVVAGAGFELCAEAMYLGKKLLAIPIAGQYEQQCNAAALRKMGVTVTPDIEGQCDRLHEWIASGKAIQLEEIADPDEIVTAIINS